ncbi:hypothetical protein WKH54_25745 [Priestia megaterium]|uniref:hypothetical protein n=1 Tax=Priestia megaterium TaxID=1404 RepID=UPI003172D8AC
MSGSNIHVKNVSPRAINSELLETTIDSVLKAGLDEFYKKAIDTNSMSHLPLSNHLM